MTTDKEIYMDSCIAMAKSNLIDIMLIDLIEDRCFEELDTQEKLKVHSLIRQKSKLSNKPLA